MNHDRCKTILIIEDDRDICDALEMVLGSEGYKVEIAQDRGMALKIIEEKAPHTVLMDYSMPGLSAEDFVRGMRELQCASDLVLMTAMGHARQKARDLGISKFLGKPFDIEQLLHVVEK